METEGKKDIKSPVSGSSTSDIVKPNLSDYREPNVRIEVLNKSIPQRTKE